MSDDGREERWAEGRPAQPAQPAQSAISGAPRDLPPDPAQTFELERRLREAGTEELLALVREQAP
ncbi:MAG TPA: hypothetical protein VHG32_19610, partial [Thermoanaerobaculia bacterium]|nr:hypothetical protein [Thermoanaerobaculia bacterium]